jgi:hypothetical protein
MRSRPFLLALVAIGCAFVWLPVRARDDGGAMTVAEIARFFDKHLGR